MSFGDRKDGKLLRDLDSMHFIMPNIYPNRCDNEAFISECIDLTALDEYLEKKNASNPEYRYNLFQFIVTAMLKAVTLRPKLNRFIANKNFYQRNEITAAFIVKKLFADDGAEALAVIRSKPEYTINDVHDAIYRRVCGVRDGQTSADPEAREKNLAAASDQPSEKPSKTEKDADNASDDAMDIVNKLPRFISKTFVAFMRFMDRHGWVPQSLIATDPGYASVFFSNLGSIKLHAGYHHLNNWGTTSIFVVVGERKKRPFYDDDGNVTMRDSVDIGLTVDERIADGYYFSKTIRLLRKLFENPELLEKPLSEEVEY